jgi:hypothetical protein
VNPYLSANISLRLAVWTQVYLAILRASFDLAFKAAYQVGFARDRAIANHNAFLFAPQNVGFFVP